MVRHQPNERGCWSLAYVFENNDCDFALPIARHFFERVTAEHDVIVFACGSRASKSSTTANDDIQPSGCAAQSESEMIHHNRPSKLMVPGFSGVGIVESGVL